MADMEKAAVSKEDFKALKALLMGVPVTAGLEGPDGASAATAMKKDADEPPGGGVEGGPAQASLADGEGSDEETAEVVSVVAANGVPSGPIEVTSFLETHVGHRPRRCPLPRGAPPLPCLAACLSNQMAGHEAFAATVRQFAASRAFTVHQGVDLMRIAAGDDAMDSFDRMDFAMVT